MAPRLALVIFLGGLGGSSVERMVACARSAATVDSIQAALSTDLFEEAVLVTDGSPPPDGLPRDTVIDIHGGQFHFGGRLVDVVSRRRLERVVYMGGGSLPLLTVDDFALVAEAAADDGVALTNNPYSSDLVAFPAAALNCIRPPDSDNRLARALGEEAGLSVRALPRTVATTLDIDGPADLAVLALTGEGGPRLRECLAGRAVDVETYRRVLPLLTDRFAQVTVAGRVGSHAWQYLESETACRVRLFAEERGMEADGRADSGQARSLLGFFAESAGLERMFAALAELGDAAVIDSRVLLGHFRVEASRTDRFLSDLGRWRDIESPFLRDLTRGATGASIPVLLGGHSLVAGGLMALNEFAWRQRERAQQRD